MGQERKHIFRVINDGEKIVTNEIEVITGAVHSPSDINHVALGHGLDLLNFTSRAKTCRKVTL